MSVADTPPDAALLAEVADALAWPLLLLRRDGTLLHANLAARTLLQRRWWITLNAQHQVQLLDPHASGVFMQALADTGRQQRLMRWVGPGGTTGAHGANGASGVVTATLTALAAPAAASGDAHHQQQPMLLALTLPHGRHADLQAFARLHALTPAESRVLERLARGDNSTRAAQALGVAATTVRAQTASLRRKTGHADVRALLQTLAALPPLAAADTAARDTL